MSRFRTVREAKEYLVRRIVEQADQDSVPLSDVERKMLFFSESGWTLPNMAEISREFDQSCDQDEYEKKIGRIIRRIREQSDGNDDDWSEAVQHLRSEDHYLLVLIDGTSESPKKLSRWEIVGVILAGGVVVAILLPFSFFIYSHVDNPALQKVIIGSTLLGLVILVAFIGSRGPREPA